MKFLCVPCDEQMKLVKASPPDRGSLSVVYGCPKCSYQMAMLTNPYETQVVGSLGVKVGAESAEGSEGASKCPFASMVQDQTGAASAPATTTTTTTNSMGEFPWTSEANSRLENIPEFARPMARTGIEKFAQEQGLSLVDEGVLEKAKQFFGM
jgi:hypothetical protein